MPGSITEPKPASHAPQKEGPVGLQPPSAPDKLPADKSVPALPSPPVLHGPVGNLVGNLVGNPVGKQPPSAANHAADHAANPAAGRAAHRAVSPTPSRVQGSGTARATVLQVVEPLVGKTLPNFAAASRSAVHEALAQTHQAVSETVTSALGTLGSWTTGLLPAGEAAQSSSEGGPPDPLVPSMLPLGDSSFLPVPGTMQVGSGGGLGLLLLGILASVLILRRRDGPLSWISFETLKPTSALLLPLERPG